MTFYFLAEADFFECGRGGSLVAKKDVVVPGSLSLPTGGEKHESNVHAHTYTQRGSKQLSLGKQGTGLGAPGLLGEVALGGGLSSNLSCHLFCC